MSILHPLQSNITSLTLFVWMFIAVLVKKFSLVFVCQFALQCFRYEPYELLLSTPTTIFAVFLTFFSGKKISIHITLGAINWCLMMVACQVSIVQMPLLIQL